MQEARALEFRLGLDARLNASLAGEALDRAAAPDEAGKALLNRAAEFGALTARGWTRTLRLARTVADLEGSTGVLRRHVAEALIYRRLSRAGGVAGERLTRPPSAQLWRRAAFQRGDRLFPASLRRLRFRG